MDCDSVKEDGRSARSRKSSKTKGSKRKEENRVNQLTADVGTKAGGMETGDVETNEVDRQSTDSRQHDFSNEEVNEDTDGIQQQGQSDSTEDSCVVSLGSAASKLRRIEDELELNEVTLGERYGEYQIDKGNLLMLEDTEIPNELEKG